jgi:tRNA(His) 5'-end guanylyltransferase
VRYELGIPEDDILYSHRSEKLKSCISSVLCSETVSVHIPPSGGEFLLLQ